MEESLSVKCKKASIAVYENIGFADKILEVAKNHEYTDGETLNGYQPGIKRCQNIMSIKRDEVLDFEKLLIDKFYELDYFGGGFNFVVTAPTIKKYAQNDGFYKTHHDMNMQQPRFLAYILYLNDVEEGGETYFPLPDITIKAEKDKLIMFPPFYTHPHAGRIPLSGEKLIAGGFFFQAR